MIVAKPDSKLVEDIESELDWDNRVVADNIDVEVEEGVVTLKGTVSSFSARRAAENDAWNNVGVKKVNNNLAVMYVIGETPIDKQIKEQIESKFLSDADLLSFKMEVEVNNGVVTLKGSVDALWKQSWAETLAERTYGVMMVKNALVVTPKSNITDEVVAEDISDSLYRRLIKPEIDKLDVSVEDGVVTFSGYVDSYLLWDRILDAARYTDGVVKIKDNLMISLD